MDVTLIYQGDEWKCGPGTWTTHLFNGLKRMGYDPGVIKIGKKHDLFEVNGITCTVMPYEMVFDICRELPSIVCITHIHKYENWIYDLIKAGCALVYHTKHTNRYSKDFLSLLYRHDTQIIAVGPIIRDYVISKGLEPENVTYIPHVYISKGSPKGLIRTKTAVCTTRIAPWKNVDIIMKANDILMADGNHNLCVWLHGSYYKGYMQKNVIGKILSWNDNINFTGPMYPSCNQGFDNGGGYDICSKAGYAIDLTNFPGITTDYLQYCALEMIDAGCVYIGHTKYIDGEILKLNHNCLSVSDPYELAEILMTSYENYQSLTKNAKELLEKHKPENVIPYYDDLLDRLYL